MPSCGVHPSVCLPVTFVDHVKTNKHIFEYFSSTGSHTILVFPYQTGWRYSDGNPPNGGVGCRWGIGRNRDSGLIAGYGRLLDVGSAKTTKLSIWHSRPRTTGYPWIAACWTTCQLGSDKKLPTTMQCRSHSRRLTSECLFVTACSMDGYAEDKRTEKNLIVRSGISEAETTNNKKLRSTFCIEAIQTWSIARPLCDSRASCTDMCSVVQEILIGKLFKMFKIWVLPCR